MIGGESENSVYRYFVFSKDRGKIFVRNKSITVLLCALILLSGCSGQPPAQPASTTPPPTALPSSTAPTLDALEGEYEYFHIDEVGATIWLPKSWAGNYVVERHEGDNGFDFAQKDFLSGEMGIRDDGTEGPIPGPDGYHVPLAYFKCETSAEFAMDPTSFSDTEPTDGNFIWLGERDGIHYTLRFPTSFSAGDPVNAEQKYEQYNAMCKDIQAYPKNASAFFKFDNENDEQFSFADVSNLEFYFGSGAGAWRTVLTVHDDGTFEGEYSDSDMGDSGTSYPNGICYVCSFTGKLSTPLKVNNYTYSVTLEQIELREEPGTEEIKDGIKYIYSGPYGLDDAEELLFYLPGAPVQELPEEYTNWARGYGDSIDTELPFCGLYNVNAEQGFSSHKKSTIDVELVSIEQEAERLKQRLQTETMPQADMTETSAELFALWDSKLNEIWGLIKQKLDAAAMRTLTAEQLDWIAYKEEEMEKAGADVEGGTLQPLVEYQKGAELTRARVYELAVYLR